MKRKVIAVISAIDFGPTDGTAAGLKQAFEVWEKTQDPSELLDATATMGPGRWHGPGGVSNHHATHGPTFVRLDVLVPEQHPLFHKPDLLKTIARAFHAIANRELRNSNTSDPLKRFELLFGELDEE